MRLNEVYQPIRSDLDSVEEVLEASLHSSAARNVSKINHYLLASPGKRIRPALVILSAKAVLGSRAQTVRNRLIKLAAAMELIHMASLVHDDLIDNSLIRHHMPTINSRWGQDVSITLGDYLYATAFELISKSGNMDILKCIAAATKAMCEGELHQVCERDNLKLLKEQYITIVTKKTASLFAASCRAGTLAARSRRSMQKAMEEYGLNFGVAFQIADDYLDIVGMEASTGKMPGQDMRSGEMTLPLLFLIELIPENEREEIQRLLSHNGNRESLKKIKSKLLASGAVSKTKEEILKYVKKAKKRVNQCVESPYKESLLGLADLIVEKGF
ncbi:MAG: polyprenyl synthetase family protein [Candidatus Omnitrophota bacterium]